MATLDIETESLESLAAAMRDGSVSASGLADWAIANHEERDETLQVYKAWEPSRFHAEAAAADAVLAAGIDLGPLQGIPVSVKDLYGLSGYPTFAGCSRELPEKWQTEGPVVRALRHQLATVSGKTHSVQFAFGALGTNPYWGTPRNPWDGENHRVPGGSSAGAGVSLWEGSALLALGSDTAGSVRMPASFTGTVGVKTSKGRWSTAGIVPLSTTLDTAGTLTRTVADAVQAFAVIDPQTTDPAGDFCRRLGTASLADFHIGVCDWYFADCDPGVAEGVKAALDELAAAGARISSVELPEVEESVEMFKRGGLTAPEFASFINNEMAAFRDDLDPNVAARFEVMEAVEAVEYMARCNRRLDLARLVREGMTGYDAVVGPTIAITPPIVDDVADPKAYHRANMGAARNTSTVNMLDLCAVTMPVALDAAGMPVGLHIICPLGEDETALAIALAAEKVLGTARQRLGVPPLGV
jgi:aspartyl-tRNA(Asn)/glutamyl-tRNA(Gln) amidotransferase subunit A